MGLKVAQPREIPVISAFAREIGTVVSLERAQDGPLFALAELNEDPLDDGPEFYAVPAFGGCEQKSGARSWSRAKSAPVEGEPRGSAVVSAERSA